MVLLQAFLDKSTKYTKSWGKRFIQLDTDTRKLSYGESSEKKPKGFIFMTKVTRAAEKNATLKPGNPDLYSFIVEGLHDDGKKESWALCCPDEASFNEWYVAIRESIAAAGLMDPLHFGLPKADPRSNIPFVGVPVEHVNRFHLLERAIIYTFIPVTLHYPENHPPQPEQLLVVGDKFLYTFTHTADVYNCVPIGMLKYLYCGEMSIGIQVERPHPDLLIKKNSNIARIADILKRVFFSVSGKNLEIDTSVLQYTDIAKHLVLLPEDPAYEVKTMTPTPKLKLKHAMDMYEKQTGQPFVYGNAIAPAPTLPKGHEHSPDAMDIDDPMARLLMKVKLNQYIVPLQRQHLDVDLLRCMEPADLASFGITDEAHQKVIIAVANGEEPAAASGAATGGAAAVPAAPAQQRGAIVLSDSDSDDGLQMPPRGAARPPIQLDDDDDDDLPMPSKKPIQLDDDSDDDLVLPSRSGNNASLQSPKPGGKKIALSDDDDI